MVEDKPKRTWSPTDFALLESLYEEHKGEANSINELAGKITGNFSDRTRSSVRNQLRVKYGEAFEKFKADVGEEKLPDFDVAVLDYVVKNKGVTVGDISRHFDKSEDTVNKCIARLREANYDIVYDVESRLVGVSEKGTVLEPLLLDRLAGRVLKIGVVADLHACSKYQQLSLMHTAYDLFDEAGVEFVIDAGDMWDGFRKGSRSVNQFELFLTGADEQVDYLVEHYPRLKGGGRTYAILGNHPGWVMKDSGYNMLRALAREREDIVYRGDYQGTIVVWEKFRIEVLHPRAGMAYAKSYRPQRYVEKSVAHALNQVSHVLKEDEAVLLPSLFVFGGFHYVFWTKHMGAHVYSAPCFQAQTPFLEERVLAPDVGALIIAISFDESDEYLWKVNHEYLDFGAFVRENDY